ncbi:MAG: LysR family transcriptional regulator substrate-binding protein [Eubacterium sp.]|uniref:LysR family transcriptional regulator substrate-binding protein n=2 Tax=unclassified Eubacterium TaxID=3100185 RepID=UPI0039922C1E
MCLVACCYIFSCFRHIIFFCCSKTYGDFTPNVVFETPDYAALRYMIEKDKGIGLLPEKFFNLQHSDKVTIVPLKEKVSRSLAIAWDKDKLLTEDEQNFLEYTKKWFDSL